MATLESLGVYLQDPDINKKPVYRRLGLLNGLLIGLALATGAWGQEVLRVAQLPVRQYLPTLLLGVAIVVGLCTLTGWLTSRIAKAWVTVPLWFGVATLVTLVIGYLGTYGRTLAVWLSDPTFWGRNIYPFVIENGTIGLIIGGFLIILVVGFLGALQDYRLSNMAGGLGGRTRLGGSTWMGLLWPMPLVFLAAFFTKSSITDPSATAANLTNQAILVAQNYEGDLRELGQVNGISYGALRGVHDQLDGDFVLNVAEVDPGNSTVIIGADFADGAWINCRIINNQLSQCYDASLPYISGLSFLLAGEPVPEDCRGCLPLFADETLPSQVAELGAALGDSPTLERVAQWGGHVLMRATGAGNESVDCWYEGVTRVTLVNCAANIAAP